MLYVICYMLYVICYMFFNQNVKKQFQKSPEAKAPKSSSKKPKERLGHIPDTRLSYWTTSRFDEKRRRFTASSPQRMGENQSQAP